MLQFAEKFFMAATGQIDGGFGGATQNCIATEQGSYGSFVGTASFRSPSSHEI